ncbi:urease accessory protein [Oceanimonas sp. GK1]|uniref:urease accessory protein UreD n=1 Tax=Oceanimonas sp. (strain GK1 / IBRC-M 10197) TaxID=511062 RepID=UPI00024954DD|nr:urease accessory protein UreD [Oceanimonas sp. GK1]AEY01534.1 urease accessory protein [Oceanimonas sp. GK1]
MHLCHTASRSSSAGYGPGRQWSAQLSLQLVSGLNCTQVKRMTFSGPLRIQRPFYPEGQPCHLYLLHPPGGLVSGDRLRIEVQAQPGSQGLLTTPSAGKVYRQDSAGVAQGQRVRLRLEENAELEWLPQETILYRGANAGLDLHIELAENARFIGWELVCLGRPAGEHWFDEGSLSQRLQLWRAGRLLLNERLQLQAGDGVHRGRAGLNGRCVFGTLLAVGPGLDDELITALRQALPEGFSVTERLGVLLVRYLGNDMNACRAGMWQAWELIRPAMLERPACFPRIWFT